MHTPTVPTSTEKKRFFSFLRLLMCHAAAAAAAAAAAMKHGGPFVLHPLRLPEGSLRLKIMLLHEASQSRERKGGDFLLKLSLSFCVWGKNPRRPRAPFCGHNFLHNFK